MKPKIKFVQGIISIERKL